MGAALLVVDLQTGMFNGARIAPIHAGEALLSRVGGLLTAARQGGMPVIYVRHGSPAGKLLEPRTANWEIHPAIAPRGGEAIVDKHSPDSFHETNLSRELAAIRAKRLIIVGAQTEVCVDTTCRRASSLGFDTVLVSDGHSTWNSETLTAEQIIAHTNETLAAHFVSLVTAEQVSERIFAA